MSAGNENVPLALDIVVAVDAPVRVMVAPDAPGPVIVPVRLEVCAIDEKVRLAFAPFSAIVWLGGVMMKPALLTATV